MAINRRPVIICPTVIADARALYERDGRSLPSIAKVFGVATSTLRLRLIADGVKMRTRTEGIRLAENLGAHLKGKKRIFTQEWKDNISAGRLAYGEINAAGVSLKPAGYIEITRGENKFRGVHRVVAEQMIGRKLRHDEHVHHIDRNRSNNAPANLMVMTASAHAALHRREDGPITKRKEISPWQAV